MSRIWGSPLLIKKNKFISTSSLGICKQLEEDSIKWLGISFTFCRDWLCCWNSLKEVGFLLNIILSKSKISFQTVIEPFGRILVESICHSPQTQLIINFKNNDSIKKIIMKYYLWFVYNQIDLREKIADWFLCVSKLRIGMLSNFVVFSPGIFIWHLMLMWMICLWTL